MRSIHWSELEKKQSLLLSLASCVGKRAAIASLCGIAAAVLWQGCAATPQERANFRLTRIREMEEAITRAFLEDLDHCRRDYANDPSGRAACFEEARRKKAQADADLRKLIEIQEWHEHVENMEELKRLQKYLDTLFDPEKWRRLIEELKNQQAILPRDSNVTFEIPLVRTGSEQIDIVLVDDIAALSEAVGTAVIREGNQNPDLQFLKVDAITYSIPAGSTGTLVSPDYACVFSISGNIQVADSAVASASAIVTDAELVVDTFGVAVKFLLDKSSPNNRLLVDGPGYGRLAFRANAQWPGNEMSVMPRSVWIEIPVVFSGTPREIAMTTGPGGCVGSALLPVTWFRSSDYNRDGVLDDSDAAAFLDAFTRGEPDTDLDGSGVLDATDVNLFIHYFEIDQSH